MENQLLYRMLHQEADYAVGCTEPAMVALAAAKAVEVLEQEPERVRVVVSPAIYKNARAVGIPNTKEKGLNIAAAIGAVVADAAGGLCIFDGLDQDKEKKAKLMVANNAVEVLCDWEESGVYARAEAIKGKDSAEVVLKDSHKVFRTIRKNGVLAMPRSKKDISNKEELVSLELLKKVSYFELLNMVFKMDIEELAYLEKGAQDIVGFAQQVLAKEQPSLAGFGAVYQDIISEGKIGKDFLRTIRVLTSTAVSERMAGVVYPVLTSTGSGNNGILVGIPLAVLINSLQPSREKAVLALAIAHFTNMYIKAFSGKVSPLCGAVTGGAGVAAAACWLFGGDLEAIGHAVEIVLANISLMICDGAKVSCAYKLGTAAEEAIIAALMAIKGNYLDAYQGVVMADVDETIKMVGYLANKGLHDIDRLLLSLVDNYKEKAIL